MLLPTDPDSLYSNGAVTAVKDLEFTVTSAKSADAKKVKQLLTSTSGLTGEDKIDSYIDGFTYSDNLEKKYNYVKFSLSEDGDIEGEVPLVESIVKYDSTNDRLVDGYKSNGTELHGESAITPINTYLNYDKIGNSTIISNMFASKTAYPNNSNRGVIDIGNDNGLVITAGDATVYYTNESTKAFNGVIIAKGDVIIDPSVESIQGMIVCGGKVIISANSNLKTVI